MFRPHIVAIIRELLYYIILYLHYIIYSYAAQHTHAVNTVYQNLGSPSGQKQELSNTVRRFETNCDIFIFYVLKLYFYFNLNNF